MLYRQLSTLNAFFHNKELDVYKLRLCRAPIVVEYWNIPLLTHCHKIKWSFNTIHDAQPRDKIL